eukprot:Em0007g318a
MSDIVWELDALRRDSGEDRRQPYCHPRWNGTRPNPQGKSKEDHSSPSTSRDVVHKSHNAGLNTFTASYGSSSAGSWEYSACRTRFISIGSVGRIPTSSKDEKPVLHRSVPADLIFLEETHIKDPAPWFTKEWRDIENKSALAKTNLLIRHWKEIASRLEGNALKAKYSRVRTIKQAEEINEAKTGLLNELNRANETLLPDKEAMDERQKRQTEAYLKKIVGAQTKPIKSWTYAQMVANKGKGPALSKKTPTSSTKVIEDKGALWWVQYWTPFSGRGKKPNQLANIPNRGGGGNERTSPETARGEGRQNTPMHVQGPQEWVRARETTVYPSPTCLVREWKAIRKKAAIDKMRLIKMWEDPTRQQGKCIKVKTDRVKTFCAVASTVAREELLNELVKEEEVMTFKKEALEAKQEKATQAFLRKLENLSISGRTAIFNKALNHLPTASRTFLRGTSPCLVECKQLDPNLTARLESLVEDAARLTSGMSLFDPGILPNTAILIKNLRQL